MTDHLLSQAEGKTLEFKRDLSSPRPLLKTLVAFANTAGGRLVVGVAQALPTALPASADSAPVKQASRLESRPESRLESSLAAKVMLLLAEAEAGKAQLARSLGHQTVSGELHKQVRRLLEQGLIEMTLPHKPNSRLQKYRLTPAGRALQAETDAHTHANQIR